MCRDGQRLDLDATVTNPDAVLTVQVEDDVAPVLVTNLGVHPRNTLVGVLENDLVFWRASDAHRPVAELHLSDKLFASIYRERRHELHPLAQAEPRPPDRRVDQTRCTKDGRGFDAGAIATGAITAVAIGLSGWQTGALTGLKQVNPVLLTAGAMGATLVFGIAWLIPQIGAGPMTIMLLFGQIVSAMTLSHFGWLGSPVQPVSMTNIIGALIMVGGIVLATRP